MNIEKEHALLPCPFCGGKPRISKQMGESLWSHDIVLWTGVQCDECEAQVGPTCEGFEVEAVDIWNRRAVLQSQKPEPNNLMLSAVIRMPFEMAMADPISRMQFYQRAQQALNELEALQSQDREDAERLNWLVEQEAQIQNLALANGTRYRLGWPDDGEAQSEWFKCPREAIDHARRIEGES